MTLNVHINRMHVFLIIFYNLDLNLKETEDYNATGTEIKVSSFL